MLNAAEYLQIQHILYNNKDQEESVSTLHLSHSPLVQPGDVTPGGQTEKL